MKSKLAMSYLQSLRNQLVYSTSAIGLTTLIHKSYCSAKTKGYFFQYGQHMIPHPEKVHKGGEDALYVDKQVIVVADGVGGWAEMGVDPGLYSKELCRKLEEFYKANPEAAKTPKKLIIAAHKATKAVGSSTICVLSLDEQTLKAAFVGDSGYAIYRKKEGEDRFEIVFKSKEQQKSFNFPYQIGSEGDPPTVAKEERHDVKVNDLIVLGTDGLFDNMSASQIRIVLDDAFKNSSQPTADAVAKLLANYAYKLSLDPNYNSPFAQHAKQERLYFKGGKSDDITVVVAYIQE